MAEFWSAHPEELEGGQDAGASVSGVRVVPEVPGDASGAEAGSEKAGFEKTGSGSGGACRDHEPARSSEHDAFDPAEIVTVCSRYEFGAINRARPYERGSRRSPKMVLDTEAGPVLIKRRAPRHGGAPRVRFCHMIQKKLEHRSYPVAKLLLTRDGATCVYLPDASGQEHAYEAFEFVVGKRFDRSAEAAGESGVALARFHRGAADLHLAPTPEGGYEPPRTCYHGVELVIHQLGLLGERLGGGEHVDVCAALQRSYVDAMRRVDELGFAGWPVQIIHGDWHPGNLVFRDRRVAAVLDLDSARLTPRCIDVAGGALQFSITRKGLDPQAWPEGLDMDRFRAFVRGYDGVEACVLSRAECSALASLMIEALIAEVVIPIVATGRFGAIGPGPMLRMVARKTAWIESNAPEIAEALG